MVATERNGRVVDRGVQQAERERHAYNNAQMINEID